LIRLLLILSSAAEVFQIPQYLQYLFFFPLDQFHSTIACSFFSFVPNASFEASWILSSTFPYILSNLSWYKYFILDTDIFFYSICFSVLLPVGMRHFWILLCFTKFVIIVVLNDFVIGILPCKKKCFRRLFPRKVTILRSCLYSCLQPFNIWRCPI